MLEKLEPPFRFALPKQAGDGELFGYYAKYIRTIGLGRDGIAHEALLNGVRSCVKSYSSWITKLVSNPAQAEFEALRKARAALPEFGENLQRGIGWLLDPKHGPVFASELIVDCDRTPSPKLSDVPRVSQEFLRQLEAVLAKILDRQIYWRLSSSNILVHRPSPTTLRPVLIDFADCGKPRWFESHTARASAVAEILAEAQRKIASDVSGSTNVLSALIAPPGMRPPID